MRTAIPFLMKTMTSIEHEARRRLPRINVRTIIYRYDDPVFIMLRHWLDGRDPVFRLEAIRPIPHISLVGTPLDSKTMRRLLRFMGDWASGLGCLVAPLFLLAPFVPWIWRVPTVLSVAPTIAREVEGRTWLALRSAPYSTRELLEAFHAAGTYRVAQIWAYVTSMRLAVVAILAMMVMIMTWFPGPASNSRLGLLDWLAYLLSAGYFLAEPLIDVAVDGAVGIIASTISRTQLTAILNGVVLRAIFWSLQVLALLLILPVTSAVLPRNLADSVPTLVLFGPAFTLALGYAPAVAVVLIVVTFVARLIILRILMAVAVWRAEAIG